MEDNQSKSVTETLKKKWSSYCGTGVNASKDDDSLVLRKSACGSEFAIVKLIGGCWSNSEMHVLEEIQTASQVVAEQRFDQLAQELGFARQPTRTFAELLKII